MQLRNVDRQILRLYICARVGRDPTKTVCILFTRATEKTITYPRQKLRINETEVEFSTNTRYLGVQIDSKLNWNLHFDNITCKAKSYIMSMIGSLNKRWGPKPPLIRWLYITVIRPRISYACVAWAHTITTLHRSIHNKCHRKPSQV